MTSNLQPTVQPPTEGAAQSHIDRAIRHVSILVVDDEPGMRNYLTRTLEPRCKKVMAAASAEEASALLDAHHFDLVLLDKNPLEAAAHLAAVSGVMTRGSYIDAEGLAATKARIAAAAK